MLIELEKISSIVGSIVGNIKSGDFEIFNLERHPFFDVSFRTVQSAFCKRRIGNTLMYLSGSINRDMVFFAQIAHRFDMIVMIVSNQNGRYGRKIDAYSASLFFIRGPIPASISIP